MFSNSKQEAYFEKAASDNVLRVSIDILLTLFHPNTSFFWGGGVPQCSGMILEDMYLGKGESVDQNYSVSRRTKYLLLRLDDALFSVGF